MFSQPPEKGPPKSSHKQKSTHKKRKNKKQRQKNNKKEATRINQILANSMSAWAENFTRAATWQLKHQVAMWKSRATALEYENQILRETLRQFYVNRGNATDSTSIGTPFASKNTQLMDYEQSYMEPSTSRVQESSTESDQEVQEEESECELEISEEYMAFLRQNFEFRKAREERKKREADEERMKEKDDISDPLPAKDRIEEFKELYGESWQRIAALDSYLLSEFISCCDSEKPGFWPNIPLRF